ncbi:MAG: c-type cytochrome [Gemmataceae bacterium]
MAGALTQPKPPADAPDRAVKIALLAASGVTLLFLVGAMVRENFLSPWRYHQRQYRAKLLGSDDEKQRQLGRSFDVRIRQIDLPQLGRSDRCVSCHVALDNPAMAGAKQPYRPHSGDVLKHHPVEKYGCTVCHQGQGRATTFLEAKASGVHWDYPMLPANMTQASCGLCHAADSPLIAKHAPVLALGRRLFVDRGCQACHKLDGVGGQLGPALDGEGLKTRHQLPMGHVDGERTVVNWLKQHFDQPQKVVAGSQMRPPRLTPAENVALTTYMLSLQRRDLPETYIAPDRIASLDQSLHHKEVRGEALYNRFCVQCHGEGSYGTWDPFFHKFMPAVRGSGLRSVADPDYLKSAIEQGRPGTLMPAWGKSGGGLTAAQVASLVDYLTGPVAKDSKPVPSEQRRGDARRGAELFGQLCAGCHGKNQLAPSLGNAAFQSTATDEFITRTIRGGRPDTAMPAFQRDGADGLSGDEILDLVAHVRSLGKK